MRDRTLSHAEITRLRAARAPTIPGLEMSLYSTPIDDPARGDAWGWYRDRGGALLAVPLPPLDQDIEVA